MVPMNTFSDPQKIIQSLEIAPGETVADFGSGSGAYAMAAAASIFKNIQSRVFAIDINQHMLERISAEAQRQNYLCMNIIWGDVESSKGSQLRDASVDHVIIANTLFQCDDISAVIAEASRILKSDAQLLVVDWSESFGHIGPKTDHVIDTESVKKEAQKHGLSFSKEVDAGEHHYGLIFRKDN